MLCDRPYVNTFAGFNTPQNSSITPGMGCDRDINAYYWPEYQKVESGTWKFQNYDMNGSYSVPAVTAYAPPDGFSGAGAGFLPEYY